MVGGVVMAVHVDRGLSWILVVVVPVLFLCGRDESFLGPEKTRNVYEACSAPKALEELPEVSFRMLWAGAGEAYRSSVTAFLANAGIA